MKVLKVLIDTKGLQAQHHLYDKVRLSALITKLISIPRNPYQVAFSSPSGLAGSELRGCNALVITTRWPFPDARRLQEFDYSEAEIESILDFVHNGGGLLLMSNHKPYHQFDAKLAKKLEFGVTIEGTHFTHQEGTLTIISGPELNSEHKVIAGPPKVRSIVTNSCCSIRSEDTGKCVVSLPNEMIDRRTGHRPDERQFFAHALEVNSGLSPEKRGRIVTIADSGFIGTNCTMYPGPGLIGHGDNLRFIMNVIRWLGGDLG